jgi:hypothetical protein
VAGFELHDLIGVHEVSGRELLGPAEVTATIVP